jgi:cytochrome P450
MTEATLLLAVIARRWRFELARDRPIELQPAITLRPRHGIRAVARRRAG